MRAALVEFLGASGARGPAWASLPRGAAPLVIAGCGGLYGAVMASHGGVWGDRAWMVLYGAVKVPLLFLATMLLAIPCFYVLNLLSGVGDDFRRVWSRLVDYQLSVALQLAALAPTALLINLTSDSRVAQLWSTLLFAGTSYNAYQGLTRAYAPLEQDRPVHRRLRRAWMGLYAFIGVQMGWDLRPFFGSPTMPVAFFRDEIGNAYVEIARILWEAVSGGSV